MPAPAMTWPDHQAWERDWWGDCANTFAEEAKQISYAHRMGLEIVPDVARWPLYDLGGRSVLDVGGGPVSLLLKCQKFSQATVLDPCAFPDWVRLRYAAAGIRHEQIAGEELSPRGHPADEVWLYNVLQHTADPELVVANARALALGCVRIFEWVDIPPCPGHPQELKAADLDRWLDGRGIVERMTGENGCVGTAYYGMFRA